MYAETKIFEPRHVINHEESDMSKEAKNFFKNLKKKNN